MIHRWDMVREQPTVLYNNHESLYRSYQIVQEVKGMLDRGDSTETIRLFIEMAELDLPIRLPEGPLGEDCG